jgi:hypothetical protein
MWSHLQPAVQHYLYGTDASVEAIEQAARHMRCVAEILEKLVISGLVRSLDAFNVPIEQ